MPTVLGGLAQHLWVPWPVQAAGGKEKMTEPLSIPNLESKSSLRDTPGGHHPPPSTGSWKPHSLCEVGLKVVAPGTGLGQVHLDSPVDRWLTCADEQTQCLPVLLRAGKVQSLFMFVPCICQG